MARKSSECSLQDGSSRCFWKHPHPTSHYRSLFSNITDTIYQHALSDTPQSKIYWSQAAEVMPAPANRLAELQRKIWSGSIPLEVRLAASDCRTYDESDPYLVQPPRLSYLPFLLLRLHAFFGPSLINPDVEAHDAWLSVEGVPLKWHYPLGLLYDLYSGAEPVNLNKDDTASSQAAVGILATGSPLPWRLTIHYTDYPGDQLIQLDSEGRALLDSYINAVKEADFIRNGSAKTVMSMSKEHSDNLWRAVQTREFCYLEVFTCSG